jgi:hypothetical protein
MPKISGREVLSEATEKSQARLLLIASVAIVSKAYQLPVEEMKLLDMEFPAAIFDVSMLLLVAWCSYSYLVKWVGDLIGFRLWYSESSIWSQFGTDMKLDKIFISGGIEALKAFHELQRAGLSQDVLKNLADDKKRLYEDFKTNVELYAVRLDHAGKKFKAVSVFGHFYVWIQGFVLPIGVATVAIYLLVKYGTFAAPLQF